jgi:hypothetical protein
VAYRDAHLFLPPAENEMLPQLRVKITNDAFIMKVLKLVQFDRRVMEIAEMAGRPV